MSERHGWLRKALADCGLNAADAARAWGVHDAVLVRFIKTGESRITASRVAALVKLLDMPRPELLARIGERPVHFEQLHDQPLSIVAAFAGALGMDINDVLERLEKPKRRKSDAPMTINTNAKVTVKGSPVNVKNDDEFEGW